jgi:hypothetical protein
MSYNTNLSARNLFLYYDFLCFFFKIGDIVMKNYVERKIYEKKRNRKRKIIHVYEMFIES